MRIVFL